MLRPPESIATLKQNERIFCALEDQHFAASLIENSFNESLAVHVSNIAGPNSLLGSLAMRKGLKPPESFDPLDDSNERTTLTETMALRGPVIYPQRLLTLMDIVVCAAADKSSGWATEINSSPIVVEPPPERRDGSTHLDPDISRGREHYTSVDGLNVHVSVEGRGRVRFGLMRNFLSPEWRIESYTSFPEPNALEKFFREQAAPFTDWVALEPGDVVIFQGKQHRDGDRLGVAHEFVTVEQPRVFDVLMPTWTNDVAIPNTRNRIIETYGLEKLGYQPYDITA